MILSKTDNFDRDNWCNFVDMKIFGYILFLFGLLLILTACPPDPDIKTCPPYCDPIDTSDTTKPQLPYDLLWQVPLFPQDSQYSITRFTNKYYHNIIFTSKKKGWNYNEIVVAFDTLGNRLWEWEDYIKPPKDISCIPHYSGNDMYITTGREVYAIDIESGTTIFQTRQENYPIPSYIIGYTSGKLYHVWNADGAGIGNTKSSLMYYNKSNNEWEVEFSLVSKDSFDVALYPPSSWINENGDTILVFFDKKYKTINENWPLRVDLYSYNATADTVMWVAKHIDHSAFALPNVNNPPIIDGDRIYLLCSRALHCFDKKTGEKIWETRFDDTGGALKTNYILADGIVIIASGGGFLIGIDKITGKFRFFKNDYGGSIEHLTYYNHRVYLTNNYGLYIGDTKTGNLLYLLKTHNYCKRTPGAFCDGVAINPEQGVMYVQDGFFLMCIKLPE